MSRKPRILTILSDGGQRKGGSTYGSFVIDGFPGEEPHHLSLQSLEAPHTSTEAEAAILQWAVSEATMYADAINLRRRSWGLYIRSDSQTLITKLNSPSKRLTIDFVGGCVQAIWHLVDGYASVTYEWVPRKVTKEAFGH